MSSQNKFIGDLIITKENAQSYKGLVEISGYLDVRQGATADLPQLTSIGGYLDVHQGATADLPQLTSIGDSLYVHQGATADLPQLTSIGDSLYVRESATADLPQLTSIGGSLGVHQGATADLPQLTSIGGSLGVRQGATADLPQLTSIGDSLYVLEGATADLPQLTSIGDSLYVRESATLNSPFTKALNYKSVDNTLFIVQSEKTTKGIKIYSGYVIKTVKEGVPVIENCFVAEKGYFYAHGETVKKAIQDVQFKLVAEKLKSEPIKEDTVITINYYRLITGACEFGVRSWMEQHFDSDSRIKILSDGIKAKDLLPMLRAKKAYGLERFEKLVSF